MHTEKVYNVYLYLYYLYNKTDGIRWDDKNLIQVFCTIIFKFL